MAYEPTDWNEGDIITAERMDKLEQGVKAAEMKGTAASLTKIASTETAQASEIAVKVNEIIDQLIARGVCNA